MPDTVRAILGFLSSVGLLIGVVLKFVDGGKKRREATYTAIPPSKPPPALREPTNPFGHQPLTDPLLSARILEANTAVMRTEAALADQRDHTRRALERAELEREEIADDARRTAAALTATQLQLRSAEAKLATLEAAREVWAAEVERLTRERNAADARASHAASELASFKHDSNSGASTRPANITPLRPPARPKGTP